MLSEIIQAVDRGDFAALVLLDLSAAFDTVDHEIILPQRLHISYGINGPVLQWFRSYLVGRTQHVRRGSTTSSAVHLACGVPQGSVIGPILFVLYTADLIALIMSLGLSPHLYADDTQIYGSCSPSHVDVFLTTVTGCVNAVADWMLSNRLQLNNDKTEFMWCATARRQHRLPTSGPTIGSLTVTPLGLPTLDLCIPGRPSLPSRPFPSLPPLPPFPLPPSPAVKGYALCWVHTEEPSFPFPVGPVSGLFAPRYFRSRERKFSLGTFAPRSKNTEERKVPEPWAPPAHP